MKFGARPCDTMIFYDRGLFSLSTELGTVHNIMMEVLDMTRKKRSPEETERREKIRELLQLANVSSMEDIQNLLKDTIAEFMESDLEAELDDELGYSRYNYQ